MRDLTEQEMMEIRGGDWSDVAKGSLWSAAIGFGLLIVSVGYRSFAGPSYRRGVIGGISLRFNC
jgi:hypothetical protein